MNDIIYKKYLTTLIIYHQPIKYLKIKPQEAQLMYIDGVSILG
jgi:hypothetical protein